MIELNRIYNEDCLEGMKRIESEEVEPYPIAVTKSRFKEESQK